MPVEPIQQRRKDLDEFLQPTDFIDCDHPATMQRANELTQACSTRAERAKALFEFVRDSHNDKRCESFVASQVLECGGNSCHQRSILLAALCRAAGIPARLHLQKVTIKNWRNPLSGEVLDMTFAHGITGIFLDPNWHLYEPVGNREKWIAWTGDERRGAEMPVRFHPDRDCLFKADDTISMEMLPLHFADLTVEMMRIIKEIDAVDFGYEQILPASFWVQK